MPSPTDLIVRVRKGSAGFLWTALEPLAMGLSGSSSTPGACLAEVLHADLCLASFLVST